MTSFLLRSATVRPPSPAGAMALAVGFAFAVVLVAVSASSATAATYYVDHQHPNASVAGPGTESQPFSTISAAIASHKGPGVSIVVKPGIYREQVTVNASGAPDAPFVIRAEGHGVVIDGADSFSGEGLWVQPGAASVSGPHELQVTDHAWLAAGVSWAPQQVFVDGRRLTPSTAPPEDLPVDAFTWIEGQGLYVDIGGDDPGRHEVLVGRRESGFALWGRSWVTIQGFDIVRAEDSGINLFIGCADVVVARNRVTFSRNYGIKANGCARIQIEDNTVGYSALHGIGLTTGTTGCVLRNNESFGNAHPAARVAKGIHLAAAPNNLLVGNRTHDNQDTGVQINPGSHACVLMNNRSWNNGDHGFDHLDAAGTTHLNNVAYGNYKDGFSIEGDSPNTQVVNCISSDNGLTTGRFDLWVNAASSVGFLSRNNILWNSTSQEPIKFMATKYSQVTDFSAASGQDQNSIQENPMFSDAVAGHFMPLPGSPAIDAADSSVPNWPTHDILGNPRFDDPAVPNTGSGPVTFADIGAVEYVPSAVDGATELTTPLPTTIGDRRVRAHAAEGAATAGTVALSSGFPNPSRGPIEFILDLPRDARVEWAVYDLQGRTVWTEDRTFAAGRAQLRWDGHLPAGARAATGVYLVRARVDGVDLTRRIIRF